MKTYDEIQYLAGLVLKNFNEIANETKRLDAYLWLIKCSEGGYITIDYDKQCLNFRKLHDRFKNFNYTPNHEAVSTEIGKFTELIRDIQIEFIIGTKRLHSQSSWNCPGCGTNNAAGWPTCDFCFKPKPKL